VLPLRDRFERVLSGLWAWMPGNACLTRHWRRETHRTPRPGLEIGYGGVPPAVSKYSVRVVF
jgi:hypothetical protein